MFRFSIQVLSCVMSFALFTSTLAFGQEGGIKIQVLNGDGGINNIEKRVVVEPVVEVLDADGRPIPKAVVMFTSPSTGPSVTFFGASRTTTLTTDDEGRASAAGMTPTAEEGTFLIDVEATHAGQKVTAQITQTNAYAPGAPKPKKGMGWKIIALVGAAAVGGVVAATRGGSDATNPNPTSVTLGSVSVGAPR